MNKKMVKIISGFILLASAAISVVGGYVDDMKMDNMIEEKVNKVFDEKMNNKEEEA